MITYDYTNLGRKIKGEDQGKQYPLNTTEPEWVSMPCGRFVMKDTIVKWKPEFHLKDNLGNTRMAMFSDGTVTKENYYIPFDMRIISLSTEPFNLGAVRNRYTYKCFKILTD